MTVGPCGQWLLAKMDYWSGPSRWKPRAGYAEFFSDGRYRCGDLDGTDEVGSWIAEGTTVFTEDPRLGNVSTWRVTQPEVLVRELSDEDTGYRGPAQMIFGPADATSFGANARKHLESLEGLGAVASAALVAAGVFFPRDLARMDDDDLHRIAAATRLDRHRLDAWRSIARGR